MKYSPLLPETIKKLQERAISARAAILQATTLAGSGHPGGSMSTIDIFLTLYEMLNINPKNYRTEERDRIVVSNGHVSPGVYTALAVNGFIPLMILSPNSVLPEVSTKDTLNEQYRESSGAREIWARVYLPVVVLPWQPY